MKPFLRNLLLFSVLPISLMILSFFSADGTIDPYYLRFTTHKQQNLIIGTSRAAQGLQPKTLDGVFESSGINSKMFNYSFTLAHSPYGPVYYEAIKKKLDENTKEGIFIIAVDPWTISSKTTDPNDSAAFEENKLCLATTKVFNNSHPNVDYLLNSYSRPIFSILTENVKNLLREPTTVLHEDGWLEVKVSMDAASTKERLNRRIKDYKQFFVPYYHFSSLRYSYLQKTIDLLHQHGDVFLIRLPVDTMLQKMDDSLMPDFDSLMTKLASDKNISYINYVKEASRYVYSDGNHLYQSSGRELSRKLAEDIVVSKRRNTHQYLCNEK